jgi:hypothetical protein
VATSYDSKCHDLAVYFLEGMKLTGKTPLEQLADRMAQRIQIGIEDDLSDMKDSGEIEEKT